MQEVTIQRDTNIGIQIVATVKPDSSSVQTKVVMGDNKISLSFEENRCIPFAINDYCEVFGERYQINQLPVVTKAGRFSWKYALTMESEMYELGRAQYLFLGADNSLRESDFSMMGTAEDFLNLLITNAGRVGSGWIKGDVIATEYKNLSFSKETCHQALSRIAEAFQTEYWVIGKKVHLVKKATDTGQTYKHGRNKGLYEITRKNLNDSSVVTRLYAYGSDKNLPENYRSYSPRLRFPGGYNPCLISNLTATIVDNGDGTQTYTFDYDRPLSPGVTDVSIEWRLTGTSDPWQVEVIGNPAPPRDLTIPNGSYEFRFRTYGDTCWQFTPGYGVATDVIVITADITVPVFQHTPLPYIEKFVEKYGVIEFTEIFEDIYPHRTGTVSGVNALDPFEFVDAAIDFDVNSHLLPGLTPKVTFNTGQLAGYTFDVASFNNSTKKFIINLNGDEKVLQIPSTTIRPAIGDKYVITDVEMPSTYIAAAEQELLDAANARLDELTEPQLQYTITLDPAFVRRYSKTMNIGDLIWLVDDDLDVQKKIRVVSVIRGIVEEDQYQVDIADVISPGTISSLIASASSTERAIRDINGQLVNTSILNNKVIGTLTFNSLPTTTTMTGFSNVVIEDATGKLFKKV